MSDPKEQSRDRARSLAREFADRGNLPGWFDALYSAAGEDATQIPWADLAPKRDMTEWLDREMPVGAGKRALVVGCGLGDDAEELSRRGFNVTAFDLAPSAIEWAKRRFPASRVGYLPGDVLAPRAEWIGAFDLIVEIFTLQVLKKEPKGKAIRNIASMLAPGGTLMVFCRARNDDEPVGELPWPLSRADLAAFVSAGLQERRLEDYADREDPAVRRFRVTYKR